MGNTARGSELQLLLDEVEEDPSHDCDFVVAPGDNEGNQVVATTRVFRAHALVVSRASPVLAKRIQMNPEQPVRLDIRGIHPGVFANCLEFMYTGSCPALRHPNPEKFTIQGLATQGRHFLSPLDELQ